MRVSYLHERNILTGVRSGKSDLGDEDDSGEAYKEGELIVRTMRWGLVPFYTKADTANEACRAGNGMINARSDNLLRVHKRLLNTRRCAVVIEGFYEWLNDEKTKRKRPFFIR